MYYVLVPRIIIINTIIITIITYCFNKIQNDLRQALLWLSYVTLEHKSSHKKHMYICSDSQNIEWVKFTD